MQYGMRLLIRVYQWYDVLQFIVIDMKMETLQLVLCNIVPKIKFMVSMHIIKRNAIIQPKLKPEIILSLYSNKTVLNGVFLFHFFSFFLQNKDYMPMVEYHGNE